MRKILLIIAMLLLPQLAASQIVVDGGIHTDPTLGVQIMGTPVTGNCVEFAAGPALVDSGGVCGGASSDTIYSADGSLAGDRTITGTDTSFRMDITAASPREIEHSLTGFALSKVDIRDTGLTAQINVEVDADINGVGNSRIIITADTSETFTQTLSSNTGTGGNDTAKAITMAGTDFAYIKLEGLEGFGGSSLWVGKESVGGDQGILMDFGLGHDLSIDGDEGVAGQVLTSGGNNSAPTWEDGGAGVTSVNGDVGPAVVLDTDDIGEGSTNLYNKVPAGGAANNVLAKNSGTDFDASFTGDAQLDTLGIGGAPDTTALLDVQSTTKGVIFPRMTNAQKEAISSPPNGMQVYDTDQEAMNFRIENIWDRRKIMTGQSLILPVHPGIEPDDVAVSSDLTLKGGLYRTTEAIKFNRLYVSVQAYGGSFRSIKVLMYQDQDADGILERVCTIEAFDPGGIGIHVATPTEDPVILLPGLDIVVLWGEDGEGDIKLFSFKNKEISLYNSPTELIMGQVPTTFTTTLSSETISPATVDPRFGGADGFVGSADIDSMPVLRLNLCVPFDTRQAIYSALSFDYSSESTAMASAQFNSDGTKMLLLGGTTIFQYSLFPGFDVSTASYDSVSFSVSSEVSFPVALALNPAGTKMFVLDSSNNDIFQYTLTSGFDLTTASYDSVSFSTTAQDSGAMGVTFNPAGTKMFMLGTTNDSVFQYTLTSGFDLTTASYDSVSFSVASEDIAPKEVKFSTAGTTMIVLGGFNDSVFQYTLTSGFDLTTASYDSVSFSVAAQDATPLGLAYSTNGEEIFIVGDSNDRVFQYSLCQ